MMAALWAGKSKIDQSQTIKIQNTVSRLSVPAGTSFGLIGAAG